MDAQTIITAKDVLIRTVVKKLSTYRDSQKDHNGIVLWSINDDINQIIKQQKFRTDLRVELDNNDLRSYAKNVRYASEPQSKTFSFELQTDYGVLFVGLVKLYPRITVRKGTLQAKEYILDWSHQTQWNIGRGIHPSNSYGVDVENYIVIKNDEPDAVKRYINQHVSSYHAKIIYENDDFFLQVLRGGLGYTRLIHEGTETPFRTEITMPLQDGDQIKLGSVDHYVLLRFKLSLKTDE